MASARWKHVGQFITLQESLQKCSERHSCVSRVESVEHITLSPQYLGRFTEGVKEELNGGLMKYSEQLQAVPINYEGIQILQRKGKIMEDSPFIHFDVKVKFIVFKPTVGCKLVGVVNKIGIDHVGCLVHRCFNASISKSNVTNRNLYHNLEIGSNCEFNVIGIETVNGVVSINGRIDEGSQKERKRKHAKSKDTGNPSIKSQRNSFLERTNEVHEERLNGISEGQDKGSKKSNEKRKKSVNRTV